MRTIQLTQGQVATVDDDLYEEINQHTWCAAYNKKDNVYYAKRNIRLPKGKQITYYLHWAVIGHPKKGFCVDHIDGNPLSNVRSNLRIVTSRQNNQNKKAHRNGKLVGAYYHKMKKRWQSQITIDKAIKHLGYFDSEQAAHNAYNSFNK